MDSLLLADGLQKALKGAGVGAIVGGAAGLVVGFVVWAIKKMSQSGARDNEAARRRSERRLDDRGPRSRPRYVKDDEDDRPRRRRSRYADQAKSSWILVMSLSLGGVVLATGVAALVALLVFNGEPQPAPGPVVQNPFDPNPFDPNQPNWNPPHAKPPLQNLPVPPKAQPANPIDEALLKLTTGNVFEQSDAATKLADMKVDGKRRQEVIRTLITTADKRTQFLPRGQMIEALGVWATDDEVPYLISMLDDADGHVQIMAIRALGPLKDARAADFLARRLEAGHWDLASHALKEIGPGAEPALQQVFTETKNDRIRVLACQILKVIGTPASQATLQAALQDPNNNLVLAAREALDAINVRATEGKNPAVKKKPALPPKTKQPPGPIDDALAALAARDGFKQLEATKKLAEMKVDNARRPEVIQALITKADKRASGSPRAQIIQALGVWAAADEVPYLISLLDDPDGGVRQNALRALGPLKDARAAIFLARRLENAFEWTVASQSLKEIGPGAEPALHKVFAEARNDHARVEGCKILKVIGTQASQPVLNAALRHPNNQVVMAARDALAGLALRTKGNKN